MKALVLASPVGVGPLPEDWNERIGNASKKMLVPRVWGTVELFSQLETFKCIHALICESGDSFMQETYPLDLA